MNDEQAAIIKAVFSTHDGELALNVLRGLAGMNREQLYVATNERDQAYRLGQIDLVRKIEQGIKYEPKGKSNVRRRKSESESEY